MSNTSYYYQVWSLMSSVRLIICKISCCWMLNCWATVEDAEFSSVTCSFSVAQCFSTVSFMEPSNAHLIAILNGSHLRAENIKKSVEDSVYNRLIKLTLALLASYSWSFWGSHFSQQKQWLSARNEKLLLFDSEVKEPKTTKNFEWQSLCNLNTVWEQRAWQV